MTFPRHFFAFLTCTAMIMVHHCKADGLPPPTGLTYQWLDPFTVNVSWQKPNGLPDDEVRYKYIQENASNNSGWCTPWRNFTIKVFTEKTGSNQWKFSVWTVHKSNESTHVYITIRAPKPRVELKDIKCFINPKEMNCSWTPGSQPFNVSYRKCGFSEEHTRGLKACVQPYSNATMNGCHLKEYKIRDRFCIYVDTAAGLSTFSTEHVSKMIHSPKLSIREEGDKLILSWTPPDFGEVCTWEYYVCVNRCNRPKECYPDMKEIPYDRSCQYEFRSKATIARYCGEIFSDFGEVVRYGTNEPPDNTVIVVAIIIPIILSVCIILSCYCFRRHSSIICPIIPDPSVIFKEMMMNENKELKPTLGSLYTPVPEPVEPCKVTLVAENSILQQNS